MLPDLVNAGFEVFATVVSTLNLRAALRDRSIKGVSPWPTIFFTTWGFWNLFYYPFLGQYWSAGAAVGMISVNVIWLYLYWRFRDASNSPEGPVDFPTERRPVQLQ